MNRSILIVDDDATQIMRLKTLLQRHFQDDVVEAQTGRDAILALQNDSKRSIQLVLLDLEMPILDGIETLTLMKEQYPNLPVIIISGTEDVGKATQSLQMGALDFLSKPVQENRLVVSIQNALKMQGLSQEVKRLNAEKENRFGFDDLIGHSSGLSDAVKKGQKAAPANIPVLIMGDTGVGKEVFARAIHGESTRAGKPFIAVNCGAIPKNLVESTLFGHEKGSFTGAISKTIGKFREAQGGTIFLDEVGELPPEAQTKLLRVLQQKEVEPVGSSQAVPIDVRVISATNRMMSDEVSEGNFREDLFFRLNVLSITLPNLQQRRQDIPQLVQHFIERTVTSENLTYKTIDKQAMVVLQNHHWPGNVRELENLIHRALVLSEGASLGVADFDLSVKKASQPDEAVKPMNSPFALSLFQEDGTVKALKLCEQEIMLQILHYYQGNVTQAAKALGIAKSTFYRRCPDVMT